MNIATPLNVVDFDAIERISKTDLAPIARKIDEERIYPEEIMRALGAAGAYGTHIGGSDAATDLSEAILAMSRASETCLSTGFCMWCQDALAWYIASSENDWLKTSILPGVARGEILGGTGMSNPMKSIAEIEPLRLKGKRVEGGYQVKGLLPWVSNLSDGGYFGVMFSVEEGDAVKTVMAIAHADEAKGVRLKLDHEFVAMGGTATVNVQFRDVFIPDEQVIGDPAPAFIKRIRGGFVLLQCGMAAGMIKSAIDLMVQVEKPLGHVNRYLEKQPADFQAEYDALVAEVLELSKTPYDESPDYWKRVLQARLTGGELAVEAAHYAMLHCGARGYVSQGVAQRRLREAYFVAIVTPATKHLRKMLAELG
ncbi:acyl-CoA/acyl-ACP dehydrogenase [Salipiger sp. P9]|uniref:acyl-CoA dehydrogenase family protein n=1 Tax=Salipiger pentaromativorans TaxID=2943193 RepID=UPI00215888AD|nr:acyl-CoA dehydrogenase family protein [Salipiger pentaromativorans]MCR8550243.1 acyl-CoA/acyl-ACP dehydrogenase [Salipiger pentaromativorans]